MTRSTVLLILLSAGASLTAQAQLPIHAAPQLQARSNLLINDNGYNLPPGSSFNSITADIDDSGRVAFPVQVVANGASSSPGIWFGSGGVGAIAFTGPEDALISSSLRMNNAGLVVFTLIDTGGADGIYRYDRALNTAARVSTTPVFPNSYSTPAINASGHIGFQANFSSGRAYASVATTAAIHVTDKGLDPASAYTYLYTPAFDDSRGIVGKVATSPDMVSNTEIRRFASDGNSVRLVADRAADANSPVARFDNSLAVSDSGLVAFIGTRFADNRRAVYRIDANGLSEIAAVDPAGLIRELEFFAPSINDAGLVAFRARDANGQAIYIGDGSSLQRVVGKGDRLATDLGLGQVGQHNNDPVFSGAPALNNRGDLAFIATLHPDGQSQVEWGTGVFVAAVAADAIFADGFEMDR